MTKTEIFSITVILTICITFILIPKIHAQCHGGGGHNHSETTKPKSEGKTVKKVIYHCEMHPEITGKKSDKCSKCNMKLKKYVEYNIVPVPVIYSCPMHPEVISENPSNCSKCGMNLIKNK